MGWKLFAESFNSIAYTKWLYNEAIYKLHYIVAPYYFLAIRLMNIYLWINIKIWYSVTYGTYMVSYKRWNQKDVCGLKKWISLNYYQSFPLSVRFYVPNNRSQRILKLMVFCQLQNNLFSNWLGKWFSEYSYASIELPILLYSFKYIHVLRCFWHL